MNTLMIPECIKQIDQVIKINSKVVESAGQAYISYLQTIFRDIIAIYKFYSERIMESVNSPGSYHDSIVKPMKAVRRDILRLIQTYILKEKNFDYFN